MADVVSISWRGRDDFVLVKVFCRACTRHRVEAGVMSTVGELVGVVFLRIVGVLAFLDSARFLRGQSSLIIFVCRGWFQENAVSPRPSQELTQLLEDEQIENTSGGNLVVIVSRHLIPMQSLNRLAQTQHQRYGEGV